MQKIKNWFKKIKNWFIENLDVFEHLLVLAIALGVFFGYSSCCIKKASADTLPIYYPPSISLNVVSTESEYFTLSVMSPQKIASSPGYYYDSWTVYPDTTGANFSISYGANVSSSVRDNSVYSTIQYTGAEGYLSSFQLGIFNYYSDGFNDTTRVPLTLFSSAKHDVSVTYVVYNPTTRTFESIIDVIKGELIGQYYRFVIDYSFSLSYFDSGLIFFQSIMINQSMFREQVTDLYYELVFESYLSDIQLEYLSNLTNVTHETVHFDILGSIVDSVDSFLETEILPDFSFYDILLIGLAIPLLIAILKLWLGG